MNLLNRFKLARVWHHEYRRICRELDSYTTRELASDLRLCPSDIDGVAREAADLCVASFVRAHPEFRPVAGFAGRGHAMGGAF